MVSLELPRGAEREYLITFGVAAVYVATMPAGEPSLVGASRDLERTQLRLQAKWPTVEIAAAYWLRGRELAEKIAASANKNLGHRADWLIPTRAEIALRTVASIAGERGVPITEHQVVMSRVHAAVDRVQAKIAEANQTGELAWFNSAFRAWRIEAKKFGLGMSYDEARARLRKEVIKRLIERDILSLSEDQLSKVFPALPKNNPQQTN